jgi:hypothetical protein
MHWRSGFQCQNLTWKFTISKCPTLKMWSWSLSTLMPRSIAHNHGRSIRVLSSPASKASVPHVLCCKGEKKGKNAKLGLVSPKARRGGRTANQVAITTVSLSLSSLPSRSDKKIGFCWRWGRQGLPPVLSARPSAIDQPTDPKMSPVLKEILMCRHYNWVNPPTNHSMGMGITMLRLFHSSSSKFSSSCRGNWLIYWLQSQLPLAEDNYVVRVIQCITHARIIQPKRASPRRTNRKTVQQTTTQLACVPLLCTETNEQTVRPCLLLGYSRGWEDINSYPGISPVGCLLVRILRG